MLKNLLKGVNESGRGWASLKLFWNRTKFTLDSSETSVVNPEVYVIQFTPLIPDNFYESEYLMSMGFLFELISFMRERERDNLGNK